MPDEQNNVQQVMRGIAEACRSHHKALLGTLDPDLIADLRLGVEISMSKLQFVRDWLDERLR